MKTVKIGLGTCGISAGGEKVYKAFQEELNQHPDAFHLKETGCIGMCYREVLVEVSNGDGSAHMYGEVTPERVGRIVEEDIVGVPPSMNGWFPARVARSAFSINSRASC